MNPDSADPALAEVPAPPPVPPRPPWWSPRRAWLPLAIALLLAAGGTARGWSIVEDRRALERDTAKAEERIEELKGELAEEARELGRQVEDVAAEREIAKDCMAAADAGVAFLHQLVKALGFLARFENNASQEAQDEMNRLIGEANRATRLCTRGLQ